jgi:N utilization substance protein B
MLTRRHIRAKVMQSIYAFNKGNREVMQTEQKFLKKSMKDMHDLFLLNLNLLVEVKEIASNYYELSKKKFLATEADRQPNLNFTNNKLIQKLEDESNLFELLSNRKLNQWKHDDEVPKQIWEDCLESEFYSDYNSQKQSSFKDDKNFVIKLFKKIIAPNDFLYDYYEDNKLTWIDDFPIVNTSLVKFLSNISEDDEHIKVPQLFANLDDEDFANRLFTKSLLFNEEFETALVGKTPNWDKDRIAELDRILIKMALCEFTQFSSIPIRVTINEYLELAKNYSTPKSATFINGVLDKLSKEFEESGKINKIGRGLM